MYRSDICNLSEKFRKTLNFKPAKILNISVNQTQRWYNAGICATFLKNSEKYSIFVGNMLLNRKIFYE